jgi:hypothetical protein
LNARNRDKIQKETNKKRKELKASTAQESRMTIEINLDWVINENLNLNEMLKLLKNKDIKSVYQYSEIVDFVKKEIVNKNSEIYKQMKEFMPDIKKYEV